MKNAFTMIELIFVIVIIGILAVIAIPKLNATRDDAKIAVELNNIANCIRDIASSYTAKGVEDNSTQACKSLQCTVIDSDDNKDGNITVTVLSSSNGKAKFCDFVKTKAEKRKLIGEHSFSGSRIMP